MLQVTSVELNAWLAAWLLPMVRILALFAASPIFNSRSIPARVKMGLALCIVVLVAPSVPATHQGIELFGTAALALVVKEMLVGLSIGFAVRILFAAVELAGELAAHMMGLSFASLFDPRLGAQTTAVGQMYGHIAVLVFLGLNFHHVVLTALIGSFTQPAEALLTGPLSPHHLALWGADIFRVAVHLALPIIAAMLITNMAMSLLSRAVPQINIFGVGFPVTLTVGFVALIIVSPHLISGVANHMTRISEYLGSIL